MGLNKYSNNILCRDLFSSLLTKIKHTLCPMIDISTYTDFRKFLRDYANEKKQQNPEWSLAIWARELGLSSTSSLTKIINGQREAGSKFCFKVIEYFKFTIEDTKHFDYLVYTSKAELKRRTDLLPPKDHSLRRDHADLSLSLPAHKALEACEMINRLTEALRSLSEPAHEAQEFHHFNIKIWSLIKKVEGQSL